MKPTLVLILILLILIVVSCGGYALGQLGKDSDSVPEVKAGLSDLASAVAKIDDEVTFDQAYGLLQDYHSCWPKLMEQNDPGFSDSKKMAMIMVTFGELLSKHLSNVESLDDAM